MSITKTSELLMLPPYCPSKEYLPSTDQKRTAAIATTTINTHTHIHLTKTTAKTKQQQ